MLLSDLHSLRDARQLSDWLAEAGAAGGKGSLSVGILNASGVRFAALRGATVESGDGGESAPLGCLAKLLTATLALESYGEPARWKHSLAATLGGQHAGNPRLLQVRLDHLANHTHGLDDSAIHRLPRDRDGWIDVAELCHAVTATPALAAPGRFHSYGNAGPWLWAALLESRCSRPYHDLLRDLIVRNLGFQSLQFEESDVCPAAGRSLQLSVRDLLAFVGLHIGGERSVHFRRLLEDPVSMPGWTPAEYAACQGWKAYGSGWFGHNAVVDDQAAVLRFNAELGLGIVAAGDRARTFTAFMRMFARALPEFTGFRPLRYLSGTALAAVDFSACEASYRSKAMSFLVRRASPVKLECNVCDVNAAAGAPVETILPLRCASDLVFFPEKSHSFDLPFLQFIQPAVDGFDYIWNGKSIWPRVRA